MPEAFTYYDMYRRLAFAFPYEENFRLRINETKTRHQGLTEETRDLTRKDKMQARKDDPTLFGADVEGTFPGIESLPRDIRDGSRCFSLSGKSIKSRGKAMGVPICDGWWLRIHLRMHGHILAISTQELQAIETAWVEKPESDLGRIAIQVGLINDNADRPSIVVVDRIRLVTLSFIDTNNSSIWWDIEKQGPCPITQEHEFRANFNDFTFNQESDQSIFSVLTSRQDVFNGIGTSHANEILHLAMEHPAQMARVILGDNNRKQNLYQAIANFFSFATSERYQKSIPSGRSGGSAFFEPQYITRNIISLQQRVYGHTKSPTKISRAHFENLLSRALLHPRYQPIGTSKGARKARDTDVSSKKVEVYAIRFLMTTREKGMKDGHFAYTVMCRTPPDCVAVRYEPRRIAIRQALGTRSAEIGIASFQDNAKKREFEKKAFLRRHKIIPAKGSKGGRPRKSKNAKYESSFTTSSVKEDRDKVVSDDNPSMAGPSGSIPGGDLDAPTSSGNASAITSIPPTTTIGRPQLPRMLSPLHIPDWLMPSSDSPGAFDDAFKDEYEDDGEDATAVLDEAMEMADESGESGEGEMEADGIVSISGLDYSDDDDDDDDVFDGAGGGDDDSR